jgi:PKHD-type hydroxylase
MMLHIPAVLSRERVAAMRTRLAAADWVDGRATVGAQGAQVKHNRQLPEGSPLALELGQQVLDAGGEQYRAHIDGALRRLPAMAGGAWLRTDVSSTLFLSDPDEYDGGELVVMDAYGSHEVKLPAGDLILYPATSVHHVEPVTRGTRVCSFFWTQSMVRDDSRRAMLLELDQNIQCLRARLGDCKELVALTGHYHNLLRQWSEV